MSLWFLWEIAVNITENSLVCYLLCKQLGFAQQKKKWVFIGLAMIVFIVSLLNYIDIQMFYNFPNGLNLYIPRIMIAISILLYAIFVFEGSISMKILWGVIPTAVAMVADFCTGLIASMIARDEPSTAQEFGIERFPLTISYLLISAILYLILANIHHKRDCQGLYLPRYLQVCLFGVLLLGIVAVDQFIDISFAVAKPGYELLSTHVIFANITLFIILLIIFVLIERMGKLAQKNTEYELENQKAKIERENYQNMETVVEVIREGKHDIRQHVQIMQSLLDHWQYDELGKYFEEVQGEYMKSIDVIITPNPTLNALLSSKLYVAKAADIHCDFRAVHLETLPAQYFDICSIVANLLDNAIEGCKKLSNPDERYIHLTIENKKEMLLILSENSYDGKYYKKGDVFLSRKDEVQHGFGLKHIRRIVEKHSGYINIKPENFIFYVSILLPLN